MLRRTSGSCPVQLLEPRLLLTLVDFTANTLTVRLTGTETELIFANSGTYAKLRVDGSSVGGAGTLPDGRVDSNQIHEIVIFGNEYSNTLDLHNVLRTQNRYTQLETVNIFGGAGDDYVTGSAFDDVISGGLGNDSLAGSVGADTLIGENGDDTLDGGVGIDSLIGGEGQDTVYAIVAGPQPDSLDDDLNDIVFAVGLPDYIAEESTDYVFDPETEQNLRLLTGEYRTPLPDGITVYGTDRVFEWGLSNYSGEWSNPVFNITGDYAVIDARSPEYSLLEPESYSLILNVNTGAPEYLFTPALANFRWSLNPDTPTRFYDATGDNEAFLQIGDITTGITKTVKLKGPDGQSFGVVQSKAGVMMGSLGDHNGEMLAVLESSRQSPTQRTIEAALILDLSAAESEDWDRLVVARYNLAGMVDASDDLYSAPDASFLALGDDRSGSPDSLKDRFVMIDLGEMPDIPGTQRLDEPNGTEGLMWSWPLLNVPSALYETPTEEFESGVLPFKLAHPTFAYGADQQVYFVGGISLSMVGQSVSRSGGNVVDYYPDGPATIGSLIAVNTQTGDFHLLTPGVDSSGRYESLVDHVSGTNQVRASGGYVFASYNTLAHRTYSGDYVRVTLGAATPEEHHITRVTKHRSGAYNNTTGVSCPECQFFPNSSADGSKLLITSTLGVDVSTVDQQASNAPSATKTFLIDFSLQGAPVDNSVPTINSGDAYEIIEGATQIATVSSVDEDIHDFRSLVYSLSGTDAAYLLIDSATGVLRFPNPPEFGVPQDADQDNVYEVDVTIQDRVGETFTQHVSVLVRDAEPRYAASRAGESLDIDAIRDTDDVVTLEFQNSGGTDRLLLAVRYDQFYEYDLDSVNTVSLSLGSGDDYFVLLSVIPAGVMLRIAGDGASDRIDTTVAVNQAVVLLGGSGADTLIGGAGPDTLIGGSGNDVVEGRAGHDVLIGSVGHDTLFGGDGDDTLLGRGGNDRLYGDAGDDRVAGNTGHDSLVGGEGNDWLLGHRGNDTIDGSAGSDVIAGHNGNDILNGNGDGDTLIGGRGNDHLMGGGGDDILDGRLGNDTVVGNSGSDMLFGRHGNDMLIGDAGSDTLDAGDGDDQLVGGLDGDLLIGGADNDILDGGGEQDTLATGGGSDTIVDAGEDIIDEAYVNWYEIGFVAP